MGLEIYVYIRVIYDLINHYSPSFHHSEITYSVYNIQDFILYFKGTVNVV